MAVTCDLFERESSIEVSPQLAELQGLGMVPTGVVESG